MGIKIIMVIVLGILGTASAFAEPDCGRLYGQLQQMQKAQAVLLDSLVKKNETLASTLDRFADELNMSAEQTKPMRSDQQEAQSLHRSAEAFRGHGEREQLLISRFQQKSQELIQQLGPCLAKAENSDLISKTTKQVSQVH